MKDWEFLLQREGDQTWLPLETSTVEILEGRYRIVVRTPCNDAEVDTYISYVSTQDDPPKRRVQQRSRQTNPDGLMAFLPFTPFRTGRWELRCRPHVAPGSLEHQWPASLQIQVLEQEIPTHAADRFDWDASASPQSSPVTPIEPATPAAQAIPAAPGAPFTPSALAATSSADIQQLAQQMSRMVVDSVLSAAESLNAAPEAAPEAATTGVNASSAAGRAEALEAESLGSAGVDTAEINTLPGQITIHLADETLTFGGDRTLTLTGELQPTSPWNAPLILTLELRDPSTTEIWDSQSISFPYPDLSVQDPLQDPLQSRPPAKPFKQTLTVPTSCTSPLLLGTATLWHAGGGSGEMEAIASTQFTGMASVETLLSQVAATEAETPEDSNSLEALQQRAASNFVVSKMGMQPTAARSNRQVNTDLLGLLSRSNAATPPGPSPDQARGFRLVPKQQLPPKLEPRPASPSPNSETGSGLDLPDFGRSRNPFPEDSRNPIFQWTPPLEIPQPDASLTGAAAEIGAIGTGREEAAPEQWAPEQWAPEQWVEGPEGPEAQVGIAETEMPPAEMLPAEMLPINAATTSWPPAEGEPTLTDAFSIPEEATLEELAELFGPPPDLALNAPTENPAQSSWNLEPTALDPAYLPDQLGFSPARNPDESPFGDGGPAPVDLAPDEDNTGGDLARLDDPLMNRLHEFVIPQPQPPKDAPALLTEVVVEDEDLPATRMAWMQTETRGDRSSDIAINAPEMQIPDGDLVVGETIRVVLRVATEPPQLCARLWLLDCQTRTLLTEPQWVTTFLPLSSEQLEATLDLQIPEGSIELQVEAIAVDPNSQRESRKITLRRTVVLAGEAETPAEGNRFNPWMS